MKKLIYFVLFISCSSIYGQSGTFTPKGLMVADVIYLKDSAYGTHPEIRYPIVKKYENKLIKHDVLYHLIEKALDGQLETLDASIDADHPYSAFEQQLPVELPEEQNYYLEHAVGVSYIENWEADISKGIFTKEVLGYEIITRYEKYGSTMYNTDFRVIYPENLKEGQKVHCANVTYEFPLVPFEHYYGLLNYSENSMAEQTHNWYDLPIKNYYGNNYRHAPLFGGINKRKLVKGILQAVENGKLEAFDFYSNKELSEKEIYLRCNAVDTLFMQNSEGFMMDTVLVRPYPLEEYTSIIFNEDWFLNPKTGFVSKDVKELAIVRTYLTVDYIDKPDLLKEIVFKIKLNQHE